MRRSPMPSHHSTATAHRLHSCRRVTMLIVPQGPFLHRRSAQAKLSCTQRPIFLAVELVRLMATPMAIKACIRRWLPLTCQDTSRIAQRPIPTHPPCQDVLSLPLLAPKAQHLKARRSDLHRSDRTSIHPFATARPSSTPGSSQASVRRPWLEGWRPPSDPSCHHPARGSTALARA